MAGIVFSFNELRSLYLAAGGPAEWADTMAAIALAESGGCRYAVHGPRDIRPVQTCVYNPSTQENSIGLWQINVMAHPQYDEFWLFEAANNAQAAVAVLGHGTPTPWSVYLSGAYRTYLHGAHGPVTRTTPRTSLPPAPPAPAATAPAPNSPFAAWRQLTYAIGSTMPTQARRARIARNAFMRAVR